MTALHKWLVVAGLSCDMLGAILVGIEFVGVSKVQKFLLSLKRFYPNYKSKSRKVAVVMALGLYVGFLVFIFYKGNTFNPISRAIKLVGGPLTYLLLSSGSVIGLYFLIIPFTVFIFGFMAEEFYEESKQEQLQVLGISGLILILSGFSLQLAANLLT